MCDKLNTGTYKSKWQLTLNMCDFDGGLLLLLNYVSANQGVIYKVCPRPRLHTVQKETCLFVFYLIFDVK